MKFVLLKAGIQIIDWMDGYNYSYEHVFFLNLMGFVLVESMITGQDTFLLCLVLTSFPTTSPLDLISNSNVNGYSTALLLVDTAKLDPAPYRGTFVPSRITDTVLRLFLG